MIRRLDEQHRSRAIDRIYHRKTWMWSLTRRWLPFDREKDRCDVYSPTSVTGQWVRRWVLRLHTKANFLLQMSQLCGFSPEGNGSVYESLCGVPILGMFALGMIFIGKTMIFFRQCELDHCLLDYPDAAFTMYIYSSAVKISNQVLPGAPIVNALPYNKSSII